MSADRLRSLADQATPGPWFRHHEVGADDSDINTVYRHATLPEQVKAGHSLLGKAVAGPPIYRNEDARLIALSPDLARWAANARDALDSVPHDERCYVTVCHAGCRRDEALLAEFDRLFGDPA